MTSPRFLILASFSRYGSRDEVLSTRLCVVGTAETSAWANVLAERLGDQGFDIADIRNTRPEPLVAFRADLQPACDCPF